MTDTAAIVLYDSKKRILLIRRSLDAPRNPGRWSFFGGHIESGETPIQAVIREAKEELGVTLKNPHLLLTSPYKNTKTYIFIHAYKKKRLMQKEDSAKGWYSLHDSLNLNLSPNVRVAIEKINEIWNEVDDR